MNFMKDIGEIFHPMVNRIYVCVISLFLIQTIYLARAFIRKCLSRKPEDRPTATEALKDVWMTSEVGKDIDLLDTVRENFNARRTFKSAISAVKAMNRIRTKSIIKGEERRRSSITVAQSTDHNELGPDDDVTKAETTI